MTFTRGQIDSWDKVLDAAQKANRSFKIGI
jgi:hypothetical protein